MVMLVLRISIRCGPSTILFLLLLKSIFNRRLIFDLIKSVGDIGRAQFLQVYAARMLCIGRYEELRAKREVAQKEKELLELKNDNITLKEKVQSWEKDKLDLESHVVELCGQKKAVEISKENHGYDMLLVGFERAKKQAEFFFPEMKFDKLDPIKVVHNGVLVDDDEVDVKGGGDHDPEV
ncbi:hypothetical protein PIB30_085795 [Stylosanthes scabra]|uniref:Uncharacterized protein n=1 Tax=Stylosanthes scabra TaxID=79078 RepID=A0ABU6RSU4_9FABA|nr:hypothetical protein [Stylosanthes scabra]